MNMITRIAGTKLIVSPFATETREVIVDVNLPRRGIVVHRKEQKQFPSAYIIGDDTIVVHPEVERAIRVHLASSAEKEFDKMFLKGIP